MKTPPVVSLQLASTVTNPTYQWGTLRFKWAGSLGEGHRARKWPRWDSDPARPSRESTLPLTWDSAHSSPGTEDLRHHSAVQLALRVSLLLQGQEIKSRHIMLWLTPHSKLSELYQRRVVFPLREAQRARSLPLNCEIKMHIYDCSGSQGPENPGLARSKAVGVQHACCQRPQFS